MILENNDVEAGVYQLVQGNKYFYLYYDSVAASDGTSKFHAKACPKSLATEEAFQPIIETLKFGSLIVDERIYYEQNLASIPPDDCKKYVHGGTLIPIEVLPELYINQSLYLQLKTALAGRYDVKAQKVEGSSVYRYNAFFNSKPDLVIEKKKGSNTLVVKNAQPDAEPSDEEYDEDEMVVAEIKKSASNRSSIEQLLAEAFNVVVTKCVTICQDKGEVPTVSAYCVLLTDEGQTGRMYKFTVDFQNATCEIIEDPNCLNLALYNL